MLKLDLSAKNGRQTNHSLAADSRSLHFAPEWRKVAQKLFVASLGVKVNKLALAFVLISNCSSTFIARPINQPASQPANTQHSFIITPLSWPLYLSE